MYLSVCDDKGNELPFGRLSMFEFSWKLSPTYIEGYDYTIINTTLIKFPPNNNKGDWCWAAQLGVSREADSPPFVLVPLERGWAVEFGDTYRDYCRDVPGLIPRLR